MYRWVGAWHSPWIAYCEQGTGGGGLNPGSTQVRTLGLDQRGGRPNINIKNLGSTQVQPRFNPGSTQVQPRFNPSSTQV